MKRYLCLFIALVMLLAVCSGCKSDDSAYYDNQTLIEKPADEVYTPDATEQTDGASADQQSADADVDADSQITDEPADAEPDTQPEEPVVEEPVVEEPVVEEPKILNPLTGEEIEADISAYRPYAIMIDNGRGALPQDGISYADILYEMTAYAGGATRCMGIFQDLSVTELIGGVRSCRSQFVDVALGYDAIYIHVGASDEGRARLYKTDCTHIDGNGSKWLYRDDWRSANIGYTHSVVVDTVSLLEDIEAEGYRIKHEEGYSYGLTFTDVPQMPDGVSALTAEVNHGGNKSTFFNYDDTTGLYYATQYDNPWVDRTTGEQLCFTNLLFVKVNGRYYDGEYLLHDTYGEGTGYYLYGGQCIEITWSRETVNDPFQYFYVDGTPLALSTGKTYVGIWTQYGHVNFE